MGSSDSASDHAAAIIPLMEHPLGVVAPRSGGEPAGGHGTWVAVKKDVERTLSTATSHKAARPVRSIPIQASTQGGSDGAIMRA